MTVPSMPGDDTMAEPGLPHRLRVELPAPGLGGPVDLVALVTIDRPEVLNALDTETMRQLGDALERLDADDTCRAIVITGAGERAFAAGADISELAGATPEALEASGRFAHWDRIRRVRTPIIAAVRGYALGGGCELAMACDLLVAADDAVFGQPEIKIGVMPGAGGTQRLTRALGKAKAMELILTGRTMSAREADARGLITRLVAREATLPTALDLAAEIASMPPLAVMAAKQAVNDAFERSLEAGIADERRAFFALFATEDQREGMAAFLAKRPPTFKGR
ncbi:MAG TPA: enoyl-CoA hydratase-related protein [Candidatus Limnocylindrales bacterium]|jgi:enoyl-CoA hydratase